MKSDLKLLVVGNSAVDRARICQAWDLAGMNFPIVEAESRAVAIAALETQPFDCVLMGEMLTDGNGLLLLEALQRQVKCPGTVILLEEANQRRAWSFLEAGANDYLPCEEITPELLCHRVWNAVRMARAVRTGRSMTLQIEQVLEDNARLNQAVQEAEKIRNRVVMNLGRNQQQLRTLQRLTDLLNQRLTNLPGLFQSMIDAVCDAIPDGEFGAIALKDPQGPGLELTATLGLARSDFEMRSTFDLDKGALGRVFATGESGVLRLDGDDRTSYPSAFPSALCVVSIESPQAGRIGVLALGNWEDAQAFDEEDLRLLIAFGEQAAIAIDNAQLINALEEREERLAFQNTLLSQQNQELENQRQQIQLQNLKLREAAQLKTQFLATMSHELRTPMNAIIGFSQLLQRQPITDSQRDMVGRILNNGKNLLALINDILDLSKIEAGRLDLKLDKFNLSNLLQVTTAELRSLSEQKQIELIVHCNLTNDAIVNDSARLRQVLVNLLSNALKFTDSGSVILEAKELTPDRLVITVKDTGIGIAPEDIPYIFEEFRQIDQTMTRRHAGTGLGLAITKWLIQMMNGHITVTSQVGKGSTFRIDLPRVAQVKPISQSPSQMLPQPKVDPVVLPMMSPSPPF
jgi:signal transduction histidine kinase/DNA-binding response OmpR family regulator